MAQRLEKGAARALRLLGGPLLIGACCGSLGTAQVTSTAATATPAAPASLSSIVIGPGDHVHIEVFDTPELEQQAVVSSAGNVNVSLLGDVHLGGETADQAAQTLDRMYLEGHLLKRPNVHVTIEQSQSMQVSLLGEVKNPGSFDVGTSRNLLDVLALAGGLADDADRHITIKRHNQPASAAETVFLPNDASNAIAASAMVNPGDTVIVPKAGLVYVLGDVGKPGGYYMDRDSKISVLEAVSKAGGVLPNAAAPSSRILRKTETGYQNLPLPLRAIQNGKKPDFQLEANDVIYVPFSYARNIVISSPAIIASASSALIYAH